MVAMLVQCEEGEAGKWMARKWNNAAGWNYAAERTDDTDWNCLVRFFWKIRGRRNQYTSTSAAAGSVACLTRFAESLRAE
jgi:hypothetical protein